MIKLSSKISIALPLFVVWLITIAILTYRLNTLGAFASLGVTRCLEYVKDVGQADPSSIRLNQSYSQWALALNMTDPSNYIKTGLGFADGKGLNLKNISPADPNNKTYMPYYFQGPGTPIVIGAMIKLFGEQTVLPYFILVVCVHLLTAFLTCILASKFFKDRIYIFGSGLLSLLCPAVLDYNFGCGIFASEPLTAPFIVLSLIAMSNFWLALDESPYSYKRLVINALSFGGALGCAAYFRDIYSTFAAFSFLVLILFGLIRRTHFKQLILFVLIGSLVLSAVEYPWKKRNARYFGEFTMSGSSYCSSSLWYQVWFDYKESSKWSSHAAMGLGNYLAPEKSKEVLAVLGKNKQVGNRFAWKSFIEAIWAKPWQALCYKLGVYDTLWCGQRINAYIYLWCLLSTVSFLAFLWLTRFRFIPELWLFPLFLLCISPIAHYEHRYSQPFFLFITPITVMYLIQYYRNYRRPNCPSIGRQEFEENCSSRL